MKGKKGFTLVELAIVIVVIGILAAIAIPRFLVMQEAAGKAALDANFDSLRTTLVAVRAKFGRFPTTDEFDDGKVGSGSNTTYFFQSPVTYLSDANYNKYIIVAEADKSKIKNATRVGNDAGCPSGFTKFYLLNTVKQGSNNSNYYADVYGALCYNPTTGDLKKQW